MDSTATAPLLLLIDDVPANLHALAAHLKADYRIKVATDGETGLSLARQADKPDLILLDVAMPGLDGHQVLTELRADEETRGIPVIFVTADSSPGGETAALDLGADDFITKPIVMPVLRARVRNVLQREALKSETLRLGLERAEQELQAARTELERARLELDKKAKLESLGQLVARFAHDIANPIGNSLLAATSIEHELGLFNRQLAEGPVARSALDQLLDVGGEGVAVMVGNLRRARELLESFKQQALDQATSQQREINLKRWLDELSYQLSPMLADTPVRLELDVPDQLMLKTQPGPLGQVIANLVSNALVHGFECKNEGCIRIAAIALPQGGVDVTVADDGVGMSIDVLERAFEPFFTTKGDSGGTGLGLDIVRHTVEEVLGGQLQVSSTPGQGTRFSLRFPDSAAPRAVESAGQD